VVVRKAFAALCLVGAVGLVLQAGAGATATNFPSKGVVVPGQTIGGISIGMTEATVVQHWGHNYTVCTSCGPYLTWLFTYPGSEPLGAGIKFNVKASSAGVKTTTTKGSTTKGKVTTTAPTVAALNPAAHVVAVFTLGSPLGWGAKGAMMFDPVSNVYNLFGNPGDAQCIGYDALTVRVGSNTMSFYTASGVIYGYALTAPSQPACQ
jgi:hypothetical protein